jgi:prepilin-type N-terminal cleavage/methylation domain-containing protein
LNLISIQQGTTTACRGRSRLTMNTDSRKSPKRNSRMRGFTIMELLVVMVITAILTAFAVPNYQRITQSLRIAGDLRDLNGTVAQAKMHAASDFTHARARANLGANTFQLEIWNKTAGCWQTVGDTVNPCTAGTSRVQQLSAGVTFGFDQVATPPLNTQAALGQADPCRKGAAGTPSADPTTTANTACIEFNSRGIAIDAGGNPTGKGALYVNNGNAVYGLTVAATGYALNWSAQDTSSNTSWQHQ